MSAPRDPPVDYDTLAEFLSALAYPTRLELMDILRFPHAIGDIRLGARRTAPGENPDRPVARPTVHRHLEQLLDGDLVRPVSDGAGGRQLYQTNPARLFTIVEELRQLSLRYAGRGPSGDATVELGSSGQASSIAGPHLVLVHGVYEGRAYPLSDETATDGAWHIGRRKGHAIWLDYDPYVSVDNALVRREGDGFVLEDHPESRNGTRVNWLPIDPSKPRVLRPADIIGVGRSLLVFVPG